MLGGCIPCFRYIVETREEVVKEVIAGLESLNF